jgi:DNA-binding response OmpR family regulator
MSRVAVVDDEKNIREVIRLALEREFLEADEYADGLAAWEGFQDRRPDLIVLDILMPRMDGMELCRKVRGLPWGEETPIIFLSSRDDEIDKILGLESGGDDYLTKPFSLRELVARIRAGLRRGLRRSRQREKTGAAGEGLFQKTALTIDDVAHNEHEITHNISDNLVLDENRWIVSWKGRAAEFTVTEFRILKSLCTNPGFIKTREQLMAAAFPEDSFPNDKAADSHIKRIRRKFFELDPGFAELESVYGLGYRWRDGARHA